MFLCSYSFFLSYLVVFVRFALFHGPRSLTTSTYYHTSRLCQGFFKTSFESVFCLFLILASVAIAAFRRDASTFATLFDRPPLAPISDRYCLIASITLRLQCGCLLLYKPLVVLSNFYSTVYCPVSFALMLIPIFAPPMRLPSHPLVVYFFPRIAR